MSSNTSLPEENILPNQDKFFSQDKLRKSARAGTQLPDSKREPYGYDPNSRFDHIFPRLHLPALHPPYKYHPEDHLSFGSEYLDPTQGFTRGTSNKEQLILSRLKRNIFSKIVRTT